MRARFVGLVVAFGVVAIGAVVVVPGASAKVGSASAASAGSEHRVVVELAPGADQGAVVGSTRAHGSRVGRRFSRIFNGFAATVTDSELARLRHDPSVRAVDPDVTFHSSAVEAPAPSWGLDRINQRLLPLDGSYTYPSTGGKGVTGYVVDTGIQPIADLGSRVLPGVNEAPNAICPADSETVDLNGHGTFVADELAGTVYGVAKQASVVPVKVLDCFGTGSLETILAGLEWVAQHAKGPSVVNMSLDANAVFPTVDQAIASLVSQRISVVVAAGNVAESACNVSPADAPGAIAVGATDISDTFANFSDFGPCVALSAPGVDITAVNSSLDSPPDPNPSPVMRSGTSQATPEVAGVAALTLAANPQGLSPAALRKCLVNKATPGVIGGLPADTANLLLYLPPNLGCGQNQQ